MEVWRPGDDGLTAPGTAVGPPGRRLHFSDGRIRRPAAIRCYPAMEMDAALTNFASIIALLYWRPHPDQLPVFFVFPALWGMADAIWQTQTNALYGVLFPRDKEAAFANYRMWESLGFVIAFAYSTFLCLEYKLYILLVVLVLTLITYPIVEYNERKNPTPPIEDGTYGTPKETTEAYEHKTIYQTSL